MRFLALSLPQYHTIPENDEWWGKGFTDWTNVKKAEPIYKGHYQPKVPLNKNYYDMSKPETLKWQADLAKKYGIYGFCYYHYWFNGKLLLQRPCEELLKHTEIDENYCFCWANESWARTWDGKDTEILIQQSFGGQEDWENHIRYLIPFFKDERYIKIDNRPVMFFYSVERIESFNEMITFWNRKLKEIGFESLYAIEFINTFNRGDNDAKTDAVCEFEPHATAKYSINQILRAKRYVCKKLGLPDYLDYEYIWRKLLNKRDSYNGKGIIRSGFVGFDNSPRKGKKGSLIIRGESAEVFGKSLEVLCKSRERNFVTDFVVINAWNEWAEGAALEPNEKYKIQYLEAIKEVVEDNRK